MLSTVGILAIDVTSMLLWALLFAAAGLATLICAPNVLKSQPRQQAQQAQQVQQATTALMLLLFGR
jgi:hypothetical protein